MTAVVTWTGHRRHNPNPQRPGRTLCGRRIDPTSREVQASIDKLPPCSRCQKASST